jgi:co-chaperonin GroES (HSP10)
MTVKEGDKVLVGQYSWDDIKYNDEEYKIVGMDYILAVVD